MTKIVINGREVDADPTKPLIHACHTNGAPVPMYCYHPGLSPVGSCRICQVEVKQGEMPPRVMVACRTPVAEGMVVDTEAPKAHDARRECLEFLLKNHPLDCPICDKAGECDLQDFAFNEGQGRGRSAEPRRKLEKRKSLGEVIVLDEERCILCSRCVRFFEDVTEKPQLTVSDMGARSVISTFLDRPLEGNYQGNLADICPVGALTLKQFRFQARVWNLRKAPSTCGECSRGCAITVEVLRDGAVKRLRPRYDPDVNEWWMCDHGRFSFDRFDRPERRAGVSVRGSHGATPVDAAEAVGVSVDILRTHTEPVVVLSPFATQEEGAAVLELCGALGVSPSFVSPEPNDLADDFLHTGDPCPNRRGLEELGFRARSAAEIASDLADAQCALLLGERVGELIGMETLAALPPRLRLIVADETVHDFPAAKVSVATPNSVERAGTWINVGGVRRKLSPSRAHPAGCVPLERFVTALVRSLAADPAAPVSGGAR